MDFRCCGKILCTSCVIIAYLDKPPIPTWLQGLPCTTVVFSTPCWLKACVMRLHRLLREPASALNGLPGQWLAALLERMRAPGQGRDDIVRRSAGLPFAFVALFLAEPVGSHKVSLSRLLLAPTIFLDLSNLASVPASC